MRRQVGKGESGNDQGDQMVCWVEEILTENSFKQVRRFAFGLPEEKYAHKKTDEPKASKKDGPVQQNKGLFTYAFCASGLLASYLSWGVLQEKLISYEYATGRIESSNFLVFCNRIVAFAVASLTVQFSKDAPLRSPLYEFSFVSLSNILSSWCQLEALKFVSFPTQVLAKSSKAVPVMAMGIIMLGKRYQAFEFVCAVAIGVGAGVFMLSQQKEKAGSNEQETSASGLALLFLYLFFDSFTSQWQGHLFKKYQMSSYQMMMGINLFSAFFTWVSLVQSGEWVSSLVFVQEKPDCLVHVVLFSMAGVVGQFFIFYTIKNLGPLVFTMIMNTRQVLSIVLSCLLFGHVIQPDGMVGAMLVFGSVGYQIFRKSRG